MAEVGTIGNFYSTWADNRWSPSNPNGTYPRVDTRASSSINGNYKNNFWLYDASLLRLKNVAIGYNIPAGLLSKYRVNALRVYANGLQPVHHFEDQRLRPEGSSESSQTWPKNAITLAAVQ